MKVATMSLLSIVCLMGAIIGIQANYGGGYSYMPVPYGYGGSGGGGGGWGNGGFRKWTLINLRQYDYYWID